jgi:hypothetical protein
MDGATVMGPGHFRAARIQPDPSQRAGSTFSDPRRDEETGLIGDSSEWRQIGCLDPGCHLEELQLRFRHFP